MQTVNPPHGIEVAAIITKNLGKNEFGLQNYLWATKKQLQRLLEAQFDEVARTYVFQIGDQGVRPCDIETFKIVNLDTAREWPAFRPYVLRALEAENTSQTKRVEAEDAFMLGAN